MKIPTGRVRRWSVPRTHETETQRQGIEVIAATRRSVRGDACPPYVATDDSAILTPRGARRFAHTLLAAADFAEGKTK